MDKILEALKGLLPAEHVKEVSSAVASMLAEARAELKSEAEDQLEQAYESLTEEKVAAEKVAYDGYQQAWGMLQHQRNMMEKMRDEYQSALDEGFEQAYQMLQVEKSKNDTIAGELYEEYDNRLAEVKEYIVDKVDEFLQYKGTEIYEQARRDVLNDPRMAEHKVALEKIIGIASDYMNDEEATFATSAKLEESRKESDALKSQVKILEGRAIRLSTENTKLNEVFRQQQALITEAKAEEAKVGKNEKREAAKNVSGRGQIVLEENLIADFGNKSPKKNEIEARLDEGTDEFYDWKVLAGVIKPS